MAQRWYVVQSKHRQEQIAAYNLRNQGFTVFFPTYKETILDKKKKPVHLVKPLFPSYFFVQFDVDMDNKWKRIKNTKGVHQLIGQNETYVSCLPDRIVEEIMERKDFILKEKDAIEFREGMELKIAKGPFAGMVGTLCNYQKNVISLFLPLLERPVRVTLKVNDVTSITP